MLQRYYFRPAKQYLLFISQSCSFNYPMETLGGHEIKLIEFINSENLLLFEMWFSILFSRCQWRYNEVYRNCKLCLGFLIRCLWANYSPGKVSCHITCWKLKWMCSLLESLLSNEVKCSSSSLLISMSNNKFIISFKTFSARKCQNKWTIDIYVSWPSSVLEN